MKQYMEEFLNFGRLCCDLTRLIPYQQLRWDLETEQGRLRYKPLNSLLMHVRRYPCHYHASA